MTLHFSQQLLTTLGFCNTGKSKVLAGSSWLDVATLSVLIRQGLLITALKSCALANTNNIIEISESSFTRSVCLFLISRDWFYLSFRLQVLLLSKIMGAQTLQYLVVNLNMASTLNLCLYIHTSMSVIMEPTHCHHKYYNIKWQKVISDPLKQSSWK